MEKSGMNKERDWISEIRENLFLHTDIDRETDGSLMTRIGDVVFREAGLRHLSFKDKEKLVKDTYNCIRGNGSLTELLKDPEVSEIMVNGPGAVFVERQGRIEQTEIIFPSVEELERLLFTIVGKTDRTVNEANPIVDLRLEDGSRMNVVLRPVAINGPIATIRKFREQGFELEELIRAGSISVDAANYLKEAVGKRKNILVSGGTGAGKTTMLNVLGGFVGESERIITIEDSAELRLGGIKNLVRLECRNSNNDGYGRVTIRELIRSSLRMRPDRIIVGEVRGEETLDMLQAMNTGHDGSLSTGHANSAKDMLARLETMVICGADLPLEAIRRQIGSAIDLVVHLERCKGGKRSVTEIVELLGYENGEYVLRERRDLVEPD